MDKHIIPITQTTKTLHTLSETLWSHFIAMVPALIACLIILALFYLIALFTRFVVRRVLSRLTTYTPLVDLAARLTYLTTLTLGVITALGTAGVNVSALVTSVGLLGFALGFAFKELLTNTLAGIMILFYRPFSIGDTISVKEFRGRVHEVNLRYTILENENGIVLLPNSTLLSDVVSVHSANPTVR